MTSGVLGQPYFVFYGDSITYGQGLVRPDETWPQLLSEEFDGAPYDNYAQSGWKFSDNETAATTAGQGDLKDRSGYFVIGIHMIGTNDLHNSPAATEATTYSRARTYIQNRKASGAYHVNIYINTIARNNTSVPANNPAINAKNHNFNNLIRVGVRDGTLASDGLDVFIDLAAVSQYVPKADRPKDTNIYGVDEIHPAPNGAILIKDVVAPVIRAILNGTINLNYTFNINQLPFIKAFWDPRSALNTVNAGDFEVLKDLGYAGTFNMTNATSLRWPPQQTIGGYTWARLTTPSPITAHWLTNASVMPVNADYFKVFAHQTQQSLTTTQNIMGATVITNAHSFYYNGGVTADAPAIWSQVDGAFCTPATYRSTPGTPEVLYAQFTHATLAGEIWADNVSVATGTATVSNAQAGMHLGTLVDSPSLSIKTDMAWAAVGDLIPTSFDRQELFDYINSEFALGL